MSDSRFDGNRVGIVANGTARPSLLRIVIEGGEVGVQVEDAAAPEMDGLTISGTTGPAVVFAGTAAGGLHNMTCRNVPFGIAVGPEVRPRLGETNCEVVCSG